MDEDRYSHVLEEIRSVLSGDDGLAAVVSVLHPRLRRTSPGSGSTGSKGINFVLGPWCGRAASEHVRIPLGEGICGAATLIGQTAVVEVVAGDGRYLACFPSTRSEIVVPVRRGGRVIGELDADSERPGAFGAADRSLLERVAALIAARVPDAVPPASWLVDEWGRESFPASDAPGRWAGPDGIAAGARG